MQAGGAAGVLSYLRSTSAIERLYLVEAASAVNRLEMENSERRDRNVAIMLANVLATGSVE